MTGITAARCPAWKKVGRHFYSNYITFGAVFRHSRNLSFQNLSIKSDSSVHATPFCSRQFRNYLTFLLPTTYKVRLKVMFSPVCVILFMGEGEVPGQVGRGLPCHPPPVTRKDQAGRTMDEGDNTSGYNKNGGSWSVFAGNVD